MKIKISAIQPNMSSAGPGLRTEVFFFGCQRACDGCINAWVQEQGLYNELTPEEILEELVKYDNPNISISGGEPLEQLEGLLALLELLKEAKFEVLIYTGFYIREIEPTTLNKLHNLTKYRVFGPFEKDDMYIKVEDSFVGSKNQMVVKTISDKMSILVHLDVYGREFDMNNFNGEETGE